MWTTDAWRAWCLENVQEEAVAKASLLLNDIRKSEVINVQEWVHKKPASAAQRARPKRKRTVFAQERARKVRRQGVKRSMPQVS